jgi:hypothetical protein
MEKEPTNLDVIEKIGRSFLFRMVGYFLAIAYAVRIILMIVTPQAYHMPGWRTIVWEAARDCAVVATIFYWQNYFANYSVRRASLPLRRRDAWGLLVISGLYLCLELPSLLDVPWTIVLCITTVLGIAIYLWEMRLIKGLDDAQRQANIRF